MQNELTKAQKARIAIRIFKTMADALALRGYYKPGGKSGETLAEALKMLSPEIYGVMNDQRIVELKGLEYVIDRLPKGVEECYRIILTAQEELDNTSFEKIVPPKRRRVSYRVSENEMCFVITSGLSEIYDILTHITFLYIEAKKISQQIKDDKGRLSPEWTELERIIPICDELKGKDLDKAIWNLSILLGRTYQDTRETYQYMEKEKNKNQTNKGLFKIIYSMGKMIDEGLKSQDKMLLIYFTPTLKEMLGHHRYSQKWSQSIKKKLVEHQLHKRPIHIISANMHSVLNLIYGFHTLKDTINSINNDDLYEIIKYCRSDENKIISVAKQYGFHEIIDDSGMYIDCQLIDTSKFGNLIFHPALRFSGKETIIEESQKPVIIVMNYAFGTQAFDALDRLMDPIQIEDITTALDIRSISVMGKAGTLLGKKGDIMLATAHVIEGSTDNYLFDNDLSKEDFDNQIPVYVGPMVTVLGTSLQNRDVLYKFKTSSWKSVGLEMEGGHYQRAISSAIIKGHISKNVKVRYAYYASDNPLESGQTLSSGSMGEEGIKPTYMITKVILEKILYGITPACP